MTLPSMLFGVRIKMETEKIVQLYRKEPDPGNVNRDTLIMRHLHMTRKIASKFVCPVHTYDDVIEYAQYQLVEAVIKAKDALINNNIRPFLIRTLHCRLLDYVSYSHRPLLPETVSETARHNLWPRRVLFTDAVDEDQYPVDETVLLDDVLHKCVEDPIQQEVVEWRFAECTFREISEHVNLPLKECQRIWYSYCSKVKEHYSEMV
jgi:RNA polymerase sigma factor (sigma-70 family)